MFISACLAYSDINAELSQRNETFSIALKMPENGDIHLTISYSQAKILADALAAIIHQAPAKELLECGNILGGMSAIFCSPYHEIDSEKGEKPSCQQPGLSVQTENILLSESA